MGDSDGIYRRPDSPYWWCWISFRGKQTRMSTKETDKKKALGFRRRKQVEALRGVNPDYDKTSWQDLERAVIQHYEDKENRTLSDVKRHLRHLSKHCAGIPVVSIDRARIGEYKKKRRKHVKQATINRELSTLRLGLRLLEADDKILKAPKVELYPENNERQRYLARDEYQKFVEALEKHAPWLIGPVELAVSTGWRRNTIMGLTWNHVDRAQMVIIAPGVLTKNKEPVVYPYDKDEVIGALIERQWQNNKMPELPYVFLNRQGTDRIKDFRKSWNNACKEARLGEGYGAGSDKGFRFHDLKRTNFVWSEEHGVSRSMTMGISGTKSDTIWKRYNIVDIRRMRRAIAQRSRSMQEAEVVQQEKLKLKEEIQKDMDELIAILKEDDGDLDEETRRLIAEGIVWAQLFLNKQTR